MNEVSEECQLRFRQLIVSYSHHELVLCEQREERLFALNGELSDQLFITDLMLLLLL